LTRLIPPIREIDFWKGFIREGLLVGEWELLMEDRFASARERTEDAV
jgi:hypothetical protein